MNLRDHLIDALNEAKRARDAAVEKLAVVLPHPRTGRARLVDASVLDTTQRIALWRCEHAQLVIDSLQHCIWLHDSSMAAPFDAVVAADAGGRARHPST